MGCTTAPTLGDDCCSAQQSQENTTFRSSQVAFMDEVAAIVEIGPLETLQKLYRLVHHTLYCKMMRISRLRLTQLFHFYGTINCSPKVVSMPLTTTTVPSTMQEHRLEKKQIQQMRNVLSV